MLEDERRHVNHHDTQMLEKWKVDLCTYNKTTTLFNMTPSPSHIRALKSKFVFMRGAWRGLANYFGHELLERYES